MTWKLIFKLLTALVRNSSVVHDFFLDIVGRGVVQGCQSAELLNCEKLALLNWVYVAQGHTWEF